jgi:hypothetical protein
LIFLRPGAHIDTFAHSQPQKIQHIHPPSVRTNNNIYEPGLLWNNHSASQISKWQMNILYLARLTHARPQLEDTQFFNWCYFTEMSTLRCPTPKSIQDWPRLSFRHRANCIPIHAMTTDQPYQLTDDNLATDLSRDKGVDNTYISNWLFLMNSSHGAVE